MIRYWYLALEKAFAHDPTTQLSLITSDTGEYVVTKLLVVVAVVVVKVDTGDRWQVAGNGSPATSPCKVNQTGKPDR